ncbi:hypothetical protein KY285_010101 [Solanum tuberosum]|nr:hypothetical protein KY285_010101 [Solanum tuberosum]
MRWCDVTLRLQCQMCCNIIIKLYYLLLKFKRISNICLETRVDRLSRLACMRSLMNTKMVEGTHVRDHVLKMIGILNELEVLVAEIDNDSQIEMTLQSVGQL